MNDCVGESQVYCSLIGKGRCYCENEVTTLLMHNVFSFVLYEHHREIYYIVTHDTDGEISGGQRSIANW